MLVGRFMASRKALVVGIDNYTAVSKLQGAVRDARAIAKLLATHEDESKNFDVRVILGELGGEVVSNLDLKDRILELFRGDSDVSLLYFAGHGASVEVGGYICGGDCKSERDGVPLFEIVGWANHSVARSRIVILDSCHSGAAAEVVNNAKISEIGSGVTILAASGADQYAEEKGGSGVFTELLRDALSGAAANVLGDITPGAVYAHIDQSLGPWAQRPVFKTNVDQFVSLRRVRSPIDMSDLRFLGHLFPNRGYCYSLNPTYEPERAGAPQDIDLPAPVSDNVAIFTSLQKLNRVGLLIPVDAPHMWHAAMQSKSVRLTALGEHYRRLVLDGMI